MARRPIRFKEPLGVVQRRSRAYMQFMAGDNPDAIARVNKLFPESDLQPLPVKRGPRTEHADLEKHVLAAVGDLLAVHPRVAFAVRINSGMVQREAQDGRLVPIWFYRWVSAPEPMKLVDYIGATKDGRLLAIECKRPSWTKPTDDRERKQAAFLALVVKIGGIAGFVTDVAQADALLAQ